MKLTDKIHLLRIDFEIAFGGDKKMGRFVNVVIVFGDKITLIDSGVKGSEEKIRQYIEGQGRGLSEIETLILSHSHPDHIGSAAKIKELTGCKIMAHEAEREWIENIEIQNQQRPVPGFFNLVDRSVKLDEFLDDGQIIQISGGPTLKIIHSPGHSKGSVNIEFVEDRIFFSADSIPLKNDIPNYDSFSDLMDSIEKIDKTDFDLLLSSWAAPLSKQDEIDHLLREGKNYMQTIDAVVKEFYSIGNYPDACKLSVDKLGLPPFLANPIVDKAFRSHLNRRKMMVETERLIIRSLDYDQLLKYIKNDDSLELDLGVAESARTISPELKEAFEMAILPMVAQNKDNYLFLTLWTIILKSENRMVGDLCFKGNPDDGGNIEIGYGTYDDFRGKGYMTEAVGGMIKWATRQSDVMAITASTCTINTASSSVLLKNHFVKVGESEKLFHWKLLLKNENKL